MTNEKYLYFMEETDGAFDAANDAVCVPLSRLKGFRANGTTTQLLIELKPMLGYLSGDDVTLVADSVLLTITANKQKEVIHDITSAINSARNIDKAMIVVSDDSNSVFASPFITGCANTITAEA